MTMISSPNLWDDPEYRKTYWRSYNARHRKERREYRQAYRAEHLERLRARDRAYAVQHREEARGRAKAWYHANRARPGRNASPEIRFWRQVEKTETCWLWKGTLARGGYGQLFLNSSIRKMMVHRFSYELHFGPIPTGLDVLHRCDHPPCVRPEHLFPGTHRDNMRDMVSKSRSWSMRRSR